MTDIDIALDTTLDILHDIKESITDRKETLTSLVRANKSTEATYDEIDSLDNLMHDVKQAESAAEDASALLAKEMHND